MRRFWLTAATAISLLYPTLCGAQSGVKAPGNPDVKTSPESFARSQGQRQEVKPTLIGSRAPDSSSAVDKLDEAGRVRLMENYGKLPMSFEANQGQTDAQVKFLSRGRGYTLFLTSNEAVLALRQGEAKSVTTTEAVLRLQLRGANPAATVTGLEELPGKSNYFLGNDPKQWRTNVPNYAKVRYEQVYPGIDLVYYGNQRQLEYDFVVAPGADPHAITLALEAGNSGVQNPKPKIQNPIRVDANGDLVIQTDGGEVRFHRPVVYQMQSSVAADREQRTTDGTKRFLDGHYVLRASKPANRKSSIVNRQFGVGFEIASYDHTKPLIIDPVLSYSTYLGGSARDQGNGIAVDSAGNAYVTGQTLSTNFPTTAGAFRTTIGGGTDAFVTKLNAAGSALVYSTYLGGSGTDIGRGIAVDASGNSYVTGLTNSTNFPTPGGFQTTFGGGPSDAFVAKLNSTGSSLLYSTYIGGGGDDSGFGIAVDSAGNAYVTGATQSTDFPTTVGGFQITLLGTQNGFVTKLNAAGSALLYSTYLGGTGSDSAFGIVVDSAGNAYVTGATQSTDFPTTVGGFQITLLGTQNAFVTKLNSTGTAPLLYSTYLGGTGSDNAFGIVVDSAGNAYVTGVTQSTDFPTTPGAFQTALAGLLGLSDAFVTKLNAAGSALVYSTYLGGSGTEQGLGIAVDTSGNAYVTGTTFSPDFPTVSPIQATCGGGCIDSTSPFVTKLNATGSALAYSTYLGGAGGIVNQGNAIVVDASNNAYVTGLANSRDFPTTPGTFQTSLKGGSDAFVAKISPANLPGVSLSPASLNFGNQIETTTSTARTVTLRNMGSAPLTITNIVPSSNFAQTNTCGTSVPGGSSCAINVTFTPPTTGAKTGTITINDNAAGSPHVVNLTGRGVLALEPSPTSLDFGTQVVGTTSSPRMVTLKSNAPVDTGITISSIVVSGDFALTSNTCPVPPAALLSGLTCTLSIAFTPTGFGTRTGGKVTVTDSGVRTPRVIQLKGFGVSAGIVTTSPTSATILSFDPQIADPTVALPPPKPVTLRNTGTGPLGIVRIMTSDQFAQTNNCPSSLPVNASCTINVNFKPTRVGASVGTLSIIHDAAVNPTRITLSGTGIAPVVTFTPPTLSFGNQIIGTTTAAKTVKMTNKGTSALTITNIVASGGDFTQTHTCGSSLAAGANCTISVRFKATTKGARTGSLTVTHNAPGSPQVVALSGFGITAPSSRGDVFVAVGQGKVQWRSSDGTLIQTLDTARAGFTAGMAFDSSGRLYVTNFSAAIVSRFDKNGNLLGLLGNQSDYTASPESIVIDAKGFVYVGSADGDHNIRKFDQTGKLLARFAEATESRGSDWIELASDKCTMFYTSEGRSIKRFDVCQNKQLPDFATALSGPLFALRLLPGGGLLVAASANILRLDSTGKVVKTYSVTGENSWFALNLDPDETSFWSAGSLSGNVFKFGIASGAQLLKFSAQTPGGTVGGLAVNGELTAGARGLTVSPTSLALPDTPINQTCRPRTVTVRNTSSAPITIQSIRTTGDFNQFNNCPRAPAKLVPNTPCTVFVRFSPKAPPGDRTGTLVITSDVSDPQTVELSGKGLAACVLVSRPGSLTVVRGTDSASLNVTHETEGEAEDAISLSCANQEPVRCVFDPGSITGNVPSRLTLNNLNAMRLNVLGLEVRGDSAEDHHAVNMLLLISDFFLTTTGSAAVAAGQTARYEVGLTPINRLAGSVSFSCSGAPAGASCSVSPGVLALDGTERATASVAVTTTARAGVGPTSGGRPTPPNFAPWNRGWSWLGFAGLWMLTLGAAARRRVPVVALAMSLRRVGLSFALLLLLAVTWAACGGGGFVSTSSKSSGTPPGTYTLTITATFSGASGQSQTPPAPLSHSTTVILTVN